MLPFIAGQGAHHASTVALNIRKVPKHMVVIGGGVIVAWKWPPSTPASKQRVVWSSRTPHSDHGRSLGGMDGACWAKIGIEFFMATK
jgi:hypothetical protein